MCNHHRNWYWKAFILKFHVEIFYKTESYIVACKCYMNISYVLNVYYFIATNKRLESWKYSYIHTYIYIYLYKIVLWMKHSTYKIWPVDVSNAYWKYFFIVKVFEFYCFAFIFYNWLMEWWWMFIIIFYFFVYTTI